MKARSRTTLALLLQPPISSSLFWRYGVRNRYLDQFSILIYPTPYHLIYRTSTCFSLPILGQHFPPHLPLTHNQHGYLRGSLGFSRWHHYGRFSDHVLLYYHSPCNRRGCHDSLLSDWRVCCRESIPWYIYAGRNEVRRREEAEAPSSKVTYVFDDTYSSRFVSFWFGLHSGQGTTCFMLFSFTFTISGGGKKVESNLLFSCSRLSGLCRRCRLHYFLSCLELLLRLPPPRLGYRAVRLHLLPHCYPFYRRIPSRTRFSRSPRLLPSICLPHHHRRWGSRREWLFRHLRGGNVLGFDLLCPAQDSSHRPGCRLCLCDHSQRLPLHYFAHQIRTGTPAFWRNRHFYPAHPPRWPIRFASLPSLQLRRLGWKISSSTPGVSHHLPAYPPFNVPPSHRFYSVVYRQQRHGPWS